jgi:predicted transcriptional regulator
MMKMLNATRRNSPMSELTAIQPRQDAKLKIKRLETTTLVSHDAFVAKSKYATSATLAAKTIIPYGILTQSQRGWIGAEFSVFTMPS